MEKISPFLNWIYLKHHKCMTIVCISNDCMSEPENTAIIMNELIPMYTHTG